MQLTLHLNNEGKYLVQLPLGMDTEPVAFSRLDRLRLTYNRRSGILTLYGNLEEGQHVEVGYETKGKMATKWLRCTGGFLCHDLSGAMTAKAIHRETRYPTEDSSKPDRIKR